MNRAYGVCGVVVPINYISARVRVNSHRNDSAPCEDGDCHADDHGNNADDFGGTRPVQPILNFLNKVLHFVYLLP